MENESMINSCDQSESKMFGLLLSKSGAENFIRPGGNRSRGTSQLNIGQNR